MRSGGTIRADVPSVCSWARWAEALQVAPPAHSSSVQRGADGLTPVGEPVLHLRRDLDQPCAARAIALQLAEVGLDDVVPVIVSPC